MSLFLLLAILIMIILLSPSFETFTSPLKITFIKDNIKQIIVAPKNQFDENLMIYFIPKTNGKFVLVFETMPQDNDLVLSDVLTFASQKDYANIVAVTDDLKTCLFLKNTNSIDAGHITEFADKQTLIGYHSPIDLLIIKVLFDCYKIPFDKKRVVQFKNIEQGFTALFQKQTIQSFFLFTNLQNPMILKRLQHQKLDIYNYDDIDINLLKFFLPHCIVSNKDLKLIFNSFHSKSVIHLCMAFNHVLYSYGNKAPYLYDYIINFYTHNHDYINYYHKFYKIHPRTLELLSTTIVEPFESIQYIIDTPYEKLFYNHEKNLLILKTNTKLQTIQTDDVLELKNQKHKIENGLYQIVQVKHNLIYAKKINYSKHNTDDPNDPLYMCYTNPNIKIKGLCLSPYDILGEKKQKKDVWDKPCEFDHECPFFQKNKNYLNYRGGCQDGYCEMPMGTNRKGFRYYEGEPLCHDNSCDKNYPDYAFVMDEYERAPKIKEYFNDNNNNCSFRNKSNFIPGNNFANTNSPSDYASKNIYYNEKNNFEIECGLITSLKHQKTKPIQENPINFQSFTQTFINQNLPENEDNFNVYSVEIKNKTFNQKNKTVKYEINAILHRDTKSHGKMVSFVFIQDIRTGVITCDSVNVLGYVPENDIKDAIGYIDGANYDSSTFDKVKFLPISQTDPVFIPNNAKQFICRRAEYLKRDRNLDATCPDVVTL